MSGEGESVTNIAKSQGSDKGKTPKGSEGINLTSKCRKLRDTTIKAFFGIDNVSGPPTLASTSAEGNHNTSPPLEEQVVIQLNQNASNEDNNVPTTEDVVTEDNIDVGRKKRKRNVKMGREWEMKRTFQVDWVAKYWFIEPVTNNDEPPTECKCTICTWKTKREKKLQLKLDTIEKHIGKVYEKQIIDGKEVAAVRWKSKEECLHVNYAIEYEEHFKKIAVIGSGSSGNPIKDGLQHAANDANLAKTVQMSVIFHILSRGRPMRDFSEYGNLLSFLRVPHYPMSHWSIYAGWEMASCLAEVEKQNVQERVKESKFISLSLDEVTAVDNTAWVCMHVYTVKDHVRQANLLCVRKMRANSTAENLYLEVKKALNEIAGMDDLTIAKKLVCVGADGAAVMQGQRTGLCARLQTSIAPYMLGIHCMAHRMNLAYKIVSTFPTVSKVEDLIRELHSYFCRSPKRFAEFKIFSEGVTAGNKILKDVETRWISLHGPAERVLAEYQSLIGVLYEQRLTVDRAPDLLNKLSDIENLLTLASLLPMLDLMNKLVKKAQDRTMYIHEYSDLRKMTCMALDSLYSDLSGHSPIFSRWEIITDLNHAENFLQFNGKNELCVFVKGFEIPMHQSKTTKRGRVLPVRKDDFDKIVKSVSENVKSISYQLSSEIRERFPREEILEAMSCVFPQFWKHFGHNPTDAKLFHNKLDELITQFSKHTDCNGQLIQGILDSNNLKNQCKLFAICMKNQMENFENPFDPGAITRFWKRISQSEVLRTSISEYFKLADLCQTMILGSVEDERVFSALGFLKSNVRNKLDKNLETCLRLFVTQYNVRDFPYERSLAIWNSTCERRGLCNTLKDGGSTSTADSNINDEFRSQSQNEDEDFTDFEYPIQNEEEPISTSQTSVSGSGFWIPYGI